MKKLPFVSFMFLALALAGCGAHVKSEASYPGLEIQHEYTKHGDGSTDETHKVTSELPVGYGAPGFGFGQLQYPSAPPAVYYTMENDAARSLEDGATGGVMLRPVGSGPAPAHAAQYLLKREAKKQFDAYDQKLNQLDRKVGK